LAFGLETRALCRTWRDGVSLWDDVLAKQPGAAFAWDMRGCAKNDLGQYTAAVADFDQAIRIAPAQPGPYLNRGFAKYRLDDLDGAIDDYAEALRLRPSDYLALNNRGLARMRKGEVRAALADFDLAVRASAGRLQAHLVFNNRSSARIRLGEFGAALADAREALRSKPNFAQAVANVGRAQRGLGNLSEATREFRRSLEMDQSDWNVWFDLADARLAAGATDEAVAAARAGVEAGGDPGRKALDQDSRLGPVRDALRTPAAHQTP
jgi:tetratricopeptide (TPR) repeat protein